MFNGEQIEKSESTYLSILTTCSLFWEFCNHDGFGTLSTIAGLGNDIKVYFLNYVWKTAVENIVLLTQSLQALAPGVSADNIRPYMSSDSLPNVLSPFHLITQSLLHDYV